MTDDAERQAKEYIERALEAQRRHGDGKRVPKDVRAHAVATAADAFRRLRELRPDAKPQ
jgi:hypothetical protein